MQNVLFRVPLKFLHFETVLTLKSEIYMVLDSAEKLVSSLASFLAILLKNG